MRERERKRESAFGYNEQKVTMLLLHGKPLYSLQLIPKTQSVNLIIQMIHIQKRKCAQRTYLLTAIERKRKGKKGNTM